MTTAPPARSALRLNLVLAGICLAVLVLPASLTGASVALPDIGRVLHADLAPLQWVVNSYNLAFACFMLAFGSLADILGRRRVFAAGTVVFAAATLVSAITSNIVVLDVARGIAGVGAAAVMTAGCAILANTFEGPQLVRAFAVLGSSAGAGLALGPSTAGLLIGAFGWRWVFLSHLLLGVIVLALIPLMPESRNPAATRVDWSGTLTFTSSLFLLMLAIVEGPQRGWASTPVLVCFVAAAALLVGFAIVEKRVAQPMFDLSLLRQARFLGVCLVPVTMSFGFVCLIVLLPSYFTGVGGFTSGRAGLTMMLLTLPVLLVPLTVGRLVALGLSNRVLLSGSVLAVGIGAAWLSVIEPDVGVGTIAGPLLLIGIGMGVTAGLVDGVAITAVKPERAGMAAGMFNTMRLASEALAIAIVSAVLVNEVHQRLTGGLSRFTTAGPADVANQVISGNLGSTTAGVAAADRPGLLDLLASSYTGALHVVLWVLVGICAAGAVLVFVLLRERGASEAPATIDPGVGEAITPPARDEIAASTADSVR